MGDSKSYLAVSHCDDSGLRYCQAPPYPSDRRISPCWAKEIRELHHDIEHLILPSDFDKLRSLVHRLPCLLLSKLNSTGTIDLLGDGYSSLLMSNHRRRFLNSDMKKEQN